MFSHRGFGLPVRAFATLFASTHTAVIHHRSAFALGLPAGDNAKARKGRKTTWTRANAFRPTTPVAAECVYTPEDPPRTLQYQDAFRNLAWLVAIQVDSDQYLASVQNVFAYWISLQQLLIWVHLKSRLIVRVPIMASWFFAWISQRALILHLGRGSLWRGL